MDRIKIVPKKRVKTKTKPLIKKATRLDKGKCHNVIITTEHETIFYHKNPATGKELMDEHMFANRCKLISATKIDDNHTKIVYNLIEKHMNYVSHEDLESLAVKYNDCYKDQKIKQLIIVVDEEHNGWWNVNTRY